MKVFYLLFVFIISSQLFAQYNICPNPSFEDYNDCPEYYSNIDLDDDTFVDEWLRPNSATSDYFHGCSSSGSVVDVPNEYFSDYQHARTGNAFAGFFLYVYSHLWREYVQAKFIEPMVADECYYIEFWVACAHTTEDFEGGVMNYTSDDFGANISDERPYEPFNAGEIDYIPQIENPEGSYLTDTSIWYKVCGFYQAAGGEEWITIGNFKGDDETDFIPIIDDGGDPYNEYVYVFIDDVLVTPLDSLIAAFLNDTIVCAPITLTAPTCGDSYLWSTGETTQEITVTESGDYWLQMETSCGSIADTAEIIFVVDSIYTTSAEVEICFTELPYTIEAFDGYDYYSWSTGATTPDITIDEEGIYYLSGFADCANFVDTFIVNVIEPIDPGLDLGNDTLICASPGWSLQLHASPGFSDYAWNTGETSANLTVTEAGNYSVIITTACETFTDDITITEDPNFGQTINLGEDLELCPPAGINSFELIATPGLPNYEWSTGSNDASIIITEAGTYSVTSELLCNTISDEIKIQLCNDLYIPNAFSPNADGINDLLELIIVDPSRLIQFQIYNRWGEIVFDGNAANYSWDGTFESETQPVGVYVYYISFYDDAGVQNIMKGNITLVK
ncbi:MAG: gliding motility-associated C-terminal domain-containing protein [Fimbriimonadaceae bacterium]|nr:gliding motility-associated C-terminal domain-containing protein [Chitinophagales bacterium]